MEIPDDRYYGIQTSRMVKVSGCAHLPIIFYPGMHRALFRIKKACALANAEIGALKPEISRAVVEACDRALKKIQDDLDESLAALYLENEQGGGGSGSTDAPYEVDYSLPMRERYITVKNYYLAYDDKAQAVEDCMKDEVAKEYLGVYYDYLLQLLKMSL